MKRFILVRHAKTEEGLHKKDKERNLVEKGIRKIHAYANILKNKIADVEVAFVSPANRTRQTADILFAHNPKTQICIEESLYAFDSNYLNFIQNVSSKWNFIALVGHNYSLEYTLNLLLQTPPTKRIPAKTSCVACFYSTVEDWQMVLPQNTYLEWILNG
ncbi:MAG: histidine phosphatase family protein [Bacteroidia bacterium]|nr:histidine phosphatase family protein [Bacteroidia bacterium]MDW8301856.1 histidine phosphatase family protein [Bacteroidia bacterium]